MYASTKRSRLNWNAADFQYKGYSCGTAYDVTLQILLLIISILTVALTTIALTMAAPKLYQKVASNAEKDNQWYSFFWAASFMASLWIIAVLVWEILAVAVTDIPTIIHLYMYNIRNMVITKLAIMVVFLIVDILVACCIISKSEKEEIPVPMVVYLLSFPLCCTCFCNKDMRSKWIQSLALSSLLLFTQLVALSALPTIMWAFVFPIQGLAVITFFAAAIFCMTALIALLIRTIGHIKDNQNLMQLLLLPVVILFLVVVILTIYIYITYITSGIKTNQVGSIVSFLASVTLTIIGWFVTKGKFLEQLFSQENDSTRSKPQGNPSTERAPLNAS